MYGAQAGLAQSRLAQSSNNQRNISGQHFCTIYYYYLLFKNFMGGGSGRVRANDRFDGVWPHKDSPLLSLLLVGFIEQDTSYEIQNSLKEPVALTCM